MKKNEQASSVPTNILKLTIRKYQWKTTPKHPLLPQIPSHRRDRPHDRARPLRGAAASTGATQRGRGAQRRQTELRVLRHADHGARPADTYEGQEGRSCDK